MAHANVKDNVHLPTPCRAAPGFARARGGRSRMLPLAPMCGTAPYQQATPPRFAPLPATLDRAFEATNNGRNKRRFTWQINILKAWYHKGCRP